MPANLALVGCVVFVVWFLAREQKKASVALWIPVIWAVILGSRPTSIWFGVEGTFESTDDYVEGSPVDRRVFLLLIAAAVFILVRRRLQWVDIVRKNKWMFIYFLYLGISVFWSDFLFTSLKRWIKDFGSVLMILIILTERNPLQATKSFFMRCVCLLVPFSVLFIKYFPQLGRGYDRWTHEPINVGVTTDKNLLGMTLFVSGLFLVWELIDLRAKASSGRRLTKAMIAPFLLLVMTVWLLKMAHSSTAKVCFVLGSAILLGMRFTTIRLKAQKFGLYVFAGAAVLLLLHATFNLGEFFVGLVGRDLTFTGRTDIWKVLLDEDVNPLIGAGHYSFWLGDRVDRISGDSWFRLNEAHNGYLEVYLNSGLIGLCLLLKFLATAANKIKTETMTGATVGAFRLAVLMGIVVYGLTEAVFRLGFLSVTLLLVTMEAPRKLRSAISRKVEEDFVKSSPSLVEGSVS